MVHLRQATGKLRFFLADIQAREQKLDNMIRQFQVQLGRLPRQAIYERITLDVALSAMAEIEERLSHAQLTRQHLLAIKQKASDELSALVLTQQVEEAKEALRHLKERSVSDDKSNEEVSAEIRRLEDFITEYSKRAERAITSGLQEGDG